ncbi:MAG: TonB-dependent receptor, partial [Calditrichaeota bacterium]
CMAKLRIKPIQPGKFEMNILKKMTIALFLLLGGFIFLPPYFSPVFSQQAHFAVIRGFVVSGKNHPLQYANVQLAGTFDGDVADSSGFFSFKTRHFGKQILRATVIGYEPAEKVLHISPGDTLRVRLKLDETLIMLDEAVVTASAFSTGDKEGVTLKSLEVVTTPGAAADIFLAIKSFPGVAMVDEGSGLFVRGGDVNETITLLDQATVVHPYKFETPTGGVFGTISPFLLSGTFFSSGGFSAKYGNAMSGVLAMESQGMPKQQEYILGLGLAAASAAINTYLPGGKLGLRFSGNQSFTDAMFRLNGRREEFTRTPRSTDGNLSLIYKYSNTGTLKFFNFASTDRVGVHVNQPSFDGIFNGKETNMLHNLQWTDIVRGWLMKTSLSLNRFIGEKNLGNFNLKQEDDTYKLRTDMEKEMSPRLHLYTGWEFERQRNRFKGEVPVYQNVLDPQAQTYTLDESFFANRFGLYGEAEAQLHRRWFASLGVRGDYQQLARQWVADPRVSLRYQLSKTSDLRFSWGVYHQFPEPYLFNKEVGNPHLKAQQSRHWVLTFEHNKDNALFRIEAYYKSYDDLAIRANEINYANIGNGYSRGIDVFFKYGAYLLTRFNGWISYSFLQSRRLQARDLGGTYLHETAPSAFDITHNLTIVGKARLYQQLSLGLSYRYATGRPVTPVVDAIKQSPFNYYLPVEGRVNSERLPAFQRLDASMSVYVPFGYGNAAVFYLGISNLTNRKNVLDYDYSPDYSTRTPRTTNYRRFIYFGVSIMLMGT